MSTDKNSLVYQDQLDDNVIEMLTEDIGSNYSLRSENTKTIVAALNEVHGKDIISHAIGSPVLSTDTFKVMGEKIEGLTADFKAKLLNLGVSVSGIDKIEALIKKIDEIEIGTDTEDLLKAYIDSLNDILTDEGVELTGEETMAELIVKVDEEFDKKNSNTSNDTFATSSFTLNSDLSSYASSESYTVSYAPGFTPSIVMVQVPEGLSGSYGQCSNFWIHSGITTTLEDVGSYAGTVTIDSVTANSFTINLTGYIDLKAGQYTWYAIGGDTTIEGGEDNSGSTDTDDGTNFYIYNNGVWRDGYALSQSSGYATVTEERNCIKAVLDGSYGNATVNLTTNIAVPLDSHDTIVFKYKMTNNGANISSYNFKIGYDDTLSQLVLDSEETTEYFSYESSQNLTGSPRIYLSYAFNNYTGNITFELYEIYLVNNSVIPI